MRPSERGIGASSGGKLRLSRRLFAADSLALLAAAGIAHRGGLGADPAGAVIDAPPQEVLAEYVQARDPSTRCEPVAAGEFAGGRWRTCRLVSQTWQGVEWVHELSVYRPSAAADASKMLLWIDGGGAGKLPQAAATPAPSQALRTLSAVANAAGLPAAVVRQVPYQPMFDGLVEDGLIAHSFSEFVRTGDASWPLLLPMVKAAVEAMNAATVLAQDDWGLAIDGFAVAGASKRGWTTWLTAAVDERVDGVLPMVIDMLSLERHVQLQIDSFGRMSEELGDYTSRGIEKLFGTPRGRELIGIVDPYAYRERLLQPKLIALGTNDPYWPLGALDLYLDGLEGPKWVSYAANSGHGLPPLRVAGLAAALGRHVAGTESLPDIEWDFHSTAAGVECVVRSNQEPDHVVVWQAASPTRDFRKATWSSTPAVGAGAAEADRWRATIQRPATGFSAAFVECQYARAPVPLMLTTSVSVQPSA